MYIEHSHIEPSHQTRPSLHNPLRIAVAGLLGVGLLLIGQANMLLAAPLLQDVSSESSPIWPIIVAILAASFVLERGIEIVWNYLEWALLNFAGWTPARLRSPQFSQFKSGTSLLVAAVIGILIANTTSMRLFAQLEPLAPALLSGVSDTWDVLVTGLLIGASTKPVHEIMGILTHFSDFLANNAIKQREQAGAALADGVLKLAESEAQSMIDVPGIGPTRINMGGDADNGDSDDNGSKSGSPTDNYIDVLHNRTSM
jgi:hypothetical protein